MAIFISASLISDYITCNRKVFYRVNKPEAAVQNKEMVIGEIVHAAIEKHWDNEVFSQEYLYGEMTSRLPGESVEYASHCLHNYHGNFQRFLTADDRAEVKFKIPYEKDIFIVGKMDRIANGNIFDWKTARSPVKNISTDPQFILYNWAYRKLYGSSATGVYYAALSTADLVRLKYDASTEDILINEIIPNVVRDMKNKNYLRNGIFRKSCYRCPYSDTCLREIGGKNGMGSRDYSTE